MLDGSKKLCLVRTRQQDNGLIRVSNLIVGQRRLITLDFRNFIAWNILGRHDGHVGPIKQWIEVDTEDPAARHGTADDCCIDRVWKNHVGDVFGNAGYLRVTIRASWRVPDPSHVPVVRMHLANLAACLTNCAGFGGATSLAFPLLRSLQLSN
jgi:hypothetical protein